MGIASLSQVLRRTLLRLRNDGSSTDGKLLERYLAQRDQAAFEELVRRHGPMVLRVCRRVLGQVQDAEDAFQATFIVLARRADRIVNHASVGSWLHGVAYRVSLQARRQLCKEKRRCLPGEPGSFPGPANEKPGWDLRAVLDEELEALPEKLRAPVVLCYLEGKTNAEAAQMLGFTTNAIEKQLIKARAMLRDRLVRRGVTLSAAGLAGLLPQETASAALPGSLLAATVKAAAGSAGASSSPAAALAEATLAALARARLQRWIVGLVALVLLGIVGGLGWVAVSPISPERANPAAGGSDDEPLHVVWKFDQRVPEDIQLYGTWWHVTGQGLVCPPSSSIVALPTPLPKKPFMVRVHLLGPAMTQSGKVGVGVSAAWISRNVAPNWVSWYNVTDGSPDVQCFFADRWMVMFVDKQLYRLHKYAQPYPSERVALALKNCVIDEIELRGLRPEEIPVELRDPEATIQRMQHGPYPTGAKLDWNMEAPK